MCEDRRTVEFCRKFAWISFIAFVEFLIPVNKFRGYDTWTGSSCGRFSRGADAPQRAQARSPSPYGTLSPEHRQQIFLNVKSFLLMFCQNSKQIESSYNVFS